MASFQCADSVAWNGRSGVSRRLPHAYCVVFFHDSAWPSVSFYTPFGVVSLTQSTAFSSPLQSAHF